VVRAGTVGRRAGVHASCDAPVPPRGEAIPLHDRAPAAFLWHSCGRADYRGSTRIADLSGRNERLRLRSRFAGGFPQAIACHSQIADAARAGYSLAMERKVRSSETNGMDLYLLRHGEAEPRSASVAEARRQLTEKGRRDVGRVIERSQTVKVKPGLILSSPYIRARQTADIAAEILK